MFNIGWQRTLTRKGLAWISSNSPTKMSFFCGYNEGLHWSTTLGAFVKSFSSARRKRSSPFLLIRSSGQTRLVKNGQFMEWLSSCWLLFSDFWGLRG
ncbi:unnamed protein product [Nesidiocoris tenuis]|uniref:Uncharacterized protein n=1 Tax=Nesidiocoris tenuis TaxID=355587 RepID=A0A6H5G0S2_9HEMI|nr:unnamed protein product [Nesidiocoris tenuis]